MEFKLPELELKILSYLWKLGNKATVQDILDHWEAEKIPRYTTILKKLQIMEQKGIVKHEKEGKAYRYIPLVSRREVSGSRIRDLTKNLFGGDKLRLIHAFLDDASLSQEEIRQIQAMLAEKEAEL